MDLQKGRYIGGTSRLSLQYMDVAVLICYYMYQSPAIGGAGVKICVPVSRFFARLLPTMEGGQAFSPFSVFAIVLVLLWLKKKEELRVIRGCTVSALFHLVPRLLPTIGRAGRCGLLSLSFTIRFALCCSVSFCGWIAV
jgi:hypothetical protein